MIIGCGHLIGALKKSFRRHRLIADCNRNRAQWSIRIDDSYRTIQPIRGKKRTAIRSDGNTTQLLSVIERRDLDWGYDRLLREGEDINVIGHCNVNVLAPRIVRHRVCSAVQTI